MEIVQLFLKIQQPGFSAPGMEASFRQMPGIKQVMIVDATATGEAALNLEYDHQLTSFGLIESTLKEQRAILTEINIHFSPDFSGVADAYGASSISLPLENALSGITAVTGVSISSTGMIRVALDPAIKGLDESIAQIIKTISPLRSGDPL
ncbi:MAG: hypothetical protein JWQ27_2701 [Ferruginibacter sp.]|nr:hypothetical protein [Ferruginibacter sp.]